MPKLRTERLQLLLAVVAEQLAACLDECRLKRLGGRDALAVPALAAACTMVVAALSPAMFRFLFSVIPAASV